MGWAIALVIYTVIVWGIGWMQGSTDQADRSRR